MRLVKGSHIVVPRITATEDAYLLQSGDGRVVFALPFEERYTLIGTTDVAFTGDPASVAISAEEESYLVALANGFFRHPLNAADIVWRFAGVRPLQDDSAADPSAVSRDYKLELDAAADRPALLTVIGGKITTARKLAEAALDLVAPHLPKMGPAWTARAPLPGGDIADGDWPEFVREATARRPGMDPVWLGRFLRRHGTLVDEVLGDARTMQDLGANLGGGLFEREVCHFRDREWAKSPDDVMWRRTKIGLHLSAEARSQVATKLQGML
jgi:glycerol-3-phosphate dehydrogenase